MFLGQLVGHCPQDGGFSGPGLAREGHRAVGGHSEQGIGKRALQMNWPGRCSNRSSAT